MRDLKSNVDIAQSLLPLSRTATADGTGVDLRGYDAAMVVFDMGLASGTSPVFTHIIEESDDNSTFTTVAAADLDGAAPVVTAANDNGVTRVGYTGGSRYIRAAISAVAGTSPVLVSSASVVRGNPSLAPLA